MPRQDGEGYAQFGWYLDELVRRHHVRGQPERAGILTEVGYPIQQPAISKFMRGEHETRSAFLVVLADERRELAHQASFLTSAGSHGRTWGEQAIKKNVRGF